MLKPGMHGFWAMLFFGISVLLVRLAVGDALVSLGEHYGEIIVTLLLVVPAWYWLQFIARSIKVVCPECGQWRMRFTGQFPLVRHFHCDACGFDYDVLPHRHDNND